MPASSRLPWPGWVLTLLALHRPGLLTFQAIPGHQTIAEPGGLSQVCNEEIERLKFLQVRACLQPKRPLVVRGSHPSPLECGCSLPPTLSARPSLLARGRQAAALPHQHVTWAGSLWPTMQHPPTRKARLPTLEEGNNLSPNQHFLCNNLHI